MQKPTIPRRHLWIAAVIAVAGALVACVVPTPQQGWRPERGPVVPHDEFPADCSLCHETGDWHAIKSEFAFDHDAETGWPLVGAHAAAECLLCHNDRGPAGVFAQRGCRGCHEDPHRGHLGTTCNACHGNEDWRPREAIAEHGSTRFPLTGAHAVTACFACHPGATVGNFQLADVHCATCHLDDARNVTAPDHAALGWNDCENCHRATSFADVRFSDHPASFPLSAGHASVSCEQCHGGGGKRFSGLSTACETCHMADYQATSEPAHVAAGFPTDCASCHRATTWERGRFDHGAFALTGAHKRTSCSDCHDGGLFAGTPSTCIACHEADFRSTKDPDHVAGGFSTDCTECHGTASFEGADFDHEAVFPLKGAHKRTDCTDCHTGNVFGGTPRDCIGCHDADFRGVRDPDHVAAGFSTDCTRCHGSNTFSGATIDHSTFALTGRHKTTDCQDCHTGGVFTGTPRDCIGCHDADFRSVRDPDHVTAGFSTDCALCHGTNTFSGAKFDHSTFPLTGRHKTTDCTACHTGGVFTGTPRDCVGCHRDDYDKTRDPDHRASSFPTMCESCHNSTTTWQGATFNHTFPIDRGPHGKLDCADCHTTPTSFTRFSCTHCHEHRKSETDKEHREVRGYSWSSPACFDCHPNGKED